MTHFRFADTVSMDLGERMADWTTAHYFRSVDGT